MGDGPSLVEVAKLAKEALRSGAMAAGVSIGESESILEQMAAAAVATGAIRCDTYLSVCLSLSVRLSVCLSVCLPFFIFLIIS